MKNQQNCFISQYTQENINPKQYENVMKNPEMFDTKRFYISIPTSIEMEMAQGLEECKDFNKTLIDLEVAENFFQTAVTGSIRSLAFKMNDGDSCEVKNV